MFLIQTMATGKCYFVWTGGLNFNVILQIWFQNDSDKNKIIFKLLIRLSNGNVRFVRAGRLGCDMIFKFELLYQLIDGLLVIFVRRAVIITRNLQQQQHEYSTMIY